MTDIESRMEANGLPMKFDSTSDKPVGDHSTTNLAATMSNAEATPVADVKQTIPVPLETSTLIKPVESTELSIIPDSQPVTAGTSKPQPNGDVNIDAPPAINGHKIPALPEPAPLHQEPSIESSFSESLVPSSIPAEISSSVAASDPSQAMSASMPESAPASKVSVSALRISPAPEAPVSDLRTSPHADALAPEVVAEIEERKHKEDNQADLPVASVKEPSTDTIVVASSAVPDNALPTPPTQSPPPAPEPAHAELPTEAPATDLVHALVPEEKPAAPAPTPVTTAPVAQDTVMEDAPAVKTAREREEDDQDMDEPVAKRARTDDNTPVSESTDFKIPDVPAGTTASIYASESANALPDGDDSVTGLRLGHMRKVISNLKKSNASTAFRLAVDPVALNIPTYPQIVKKPMDLGTIDQNLKNNSYTSVNDFIRDFELIVNNCILFNGREHGVTQQALKMQSSFVNQMSQLPPAAMQEPSKAEKKAMKLKTEPMRQAPPRRPSITTPGSAKSPKAAAPPTPSFAPGPDGVPLIRRDSTLQTDRPKRAIIPSKRNSDFAGVRPKKKKYELQLRFCQEALKDISNPKHWQTNQYFTHPVDPVALNIPTYFQVIKKPMDLGTIQGKLDANQYEKAKDFEEDVRQIFKNCYKFNPEGDFVNQKGHELEELFDQKWATKDDWIAAREPHSEPSEVEDIDDEEEASEEDENDSEDDRNDKIKALQAQIEAMSKQMGELTQVKKKKKSPPTAAKKGGKSKPKKEKASATFPGLTKTKEKKKSISKPKAEKDRYVTFAEKQYISNGIAMLPERQMQEALKIIQNSVPSLANSDQNEIELDIEEVPNHALLKLLNFVKKYAGPPPDEPETRATESYAPPAVERSKKSKPMSKSEQEAQIAELKGKLGAYGGPVSPDAVQSVETGGDSSDESADSEESEEE